VSENSFRAHGVSPEVDRALAARNITTPFRIQSLVLADALAGTDVLAKSPTGSGKTLAFALPIVERIQSGSSPSALVLVPTRELALQVCDEIAVVAAPKQLSVATVYGGAPLGAQAKRARTADVVVATPGRLQDLIDRRMLSLERVRILVLDEADRMLDMGFKPQVERILKRIPGKRQTMLFSATLDGEVLELARTYTQNPARFEAELPKDLEQGEVDHKFIPVTAAAKVDALVQELERDRDLALVFVRTKRGAERLVQKLARKDVKAAALHGDMTQGARERALKRFRRGDVTTLVATDVAARGLDLDNITHVINFDPPADDTAYVHRVGRTGRAGRSGSGVTLVLPEQQADVSRVARMLGHMQQFQHEGMRVAPARRVYTSRRGRRSRW
jgi:ATP-dependent RNA helicase RhlE